MEFEESIFGRIESSLAQPVSRRQVLMLGLSLATIPLAAACASGEAPPKVTLTPNTEAPEPITTTVVNLRRGPFAYMATPPEVAGDAAETEEILFYKRNPVITEIIQSGRAQVFHVGRHNGRADHIDGDPTRLSPSLDPAVSAAETLKPNQPFTWAVEAYTSEGLVVPDFIFRGNNPSLQQVDTRWALVLYAGNQPLPDRNLARESLIQFRFVSVAQSDSGLQLDYASPTTGTPKRIR